MEKSGVERKEKERKEQRRRERGLRSNRRTIINDSSRVPRIKSDIWRKLTGPEIPLPLVLAVCTVL
jgi:hypothetical protein